MRKYLNVKQTMELTGLTYHRLLKYANKGFLPVCKIPSGKKSTYLFPEAELEARLRSLELKPL